ncbi:uncharacterized protein LOC116172405 [Photinus pyralis]|uniref:uncharacterized protein LOC116167550 n=1 Tax=Photinus pyralis TaxID=7054 RepID=UPI00126775F6|nr:uncharacterized protein LOC116167550 [Photinus pyralis]XP_031345474.1 uncharacterized protein LOC116172405 [Photinus pyralis]
MNFANAKKIGVLSAAAGVICVLLMKQLKQKTKKKRRIWSEKWLLKRQDGRGVLHMLEQELRTEDPESYRQFIRMCGQHFDELLECIRSDIVKQTTNMRESISAEARLALTLRFLATGETYRSLMFATRIHESTISLIIPDVCNAICEKLKSVYLQMPTTELEWRVIASEFQKHWNFPLCLGAIDGKHINFRPPRSSGSYYFNYKGDHSIVLLAVADASYKFLYVDIGVNGRVSDGGVYRESSLKWAIDHNTLNFPPHECLPGQNTQLPYTFVADDAFPLSTRIMKPYHSRGLTNERRIFNYRLSRARRVIENSFGILANRFRILLNTINLNPDKVELITLTCCILHNFLLEKNPRYLEPSENTEDNIGKLKKLTDMQGGNRAASEALEARNLFSRFFVTNGAVPWQNDVL